MQSPSACSRRSFLFVALVLMVFVAMFDIALYAMASAGGGAAPLASWVPSWLSDVLMHGFSSVVLPSTVVIWLVTVLVLWRFHAGLFKKLGATDTDAARKSQGKKTQASGGPVPDPAAVLNRERRFYVHLLTLMQREGRLIDFLFENLETYEDAQIGAAARSVHSGCRKILDRYLTVAPLLSEAEESPITIPPGFDPRSMTLTGNVTGEPPFSGQVRHRGWQVKRFNLPTLTETEDAAVLTPAEIEIG
ncbi:MAG: DUF2760 domain-containing protein [Desulfobacterales bacterium]|nr:DUF2760 domain-containing protein [Desulfobacterales bacterium]